MNLTQQIQALIEQAEQARTSVGVNKKYLNKTIDRLTDAWLYSQQLTIAGSIGSKAPIQDVITDSDLCSCVQGAIDKGCIIHGGTN